MLDPIIFGIDVYPHYAKSINKFGDRYYALVIGEGNAITRRLKVSRGHLLQLVHRHKPSIIAVDNIFELAPDLEDLRRMFSALPAETRVIQVTGTPKDAISLQDAAVQFGFKPPLKTSPFEEGELCVKLVALSVGSEVRVLGNETKILVSRSVSLGPGGSSQTRYRRKIHVSILNMTRSIEKALRREGIDYDLFPEEADFGLERANFTVYAPRTRLRGIIHSGHGEHIRVKVSPTYRERIEFVDWNSSLPISSPNNQDKRLIVGIDPGTTCGLAVITFDATPLYVGSKKGLTRGELLSIVTSLGKTVIVAADVVKVPTFVGKLAKTLDAVVFTPETLLGAVEKQNITQEYVKKHDLSLKGSHARDALAAAIKAFQHYRNKFEQIEAEVKKAQLSIPLDEVKALVVKGQSVQKAISLMSYYKPIDNEEETSFEILRPISGDDEIRNLRRAISIYKDQVKRVRETNERLMIQVKSLESRIAMFRGSLDAERRREIREIRRDREYQVLKREIKKLREQLSRFQQEVEQPQRLASSAFREMVHKDEMTLLKPVEFFTKEGLEQAYKLYDVGQGDILILLDSSGGGSSTSEKMVERGIKAVVVCTPMAYQAEEVFKRYSIPILAYKGLKIEWVEGYPYIRSDALNSALNEAETQSRHNSEKIIREIIDEYREERKKARRA